MKYIGNKILTITCLITLSALLLVSCTDYLDLQPTTDISENTFWTGEGDALLALTGCYKIPTGFTSQDFSLNHCMMFLDFAGGNGVEKENVTTQQMASSELVSTSRTLQSIWGNAYGQIAHHNTFLEKISACPMDENKKALWSAEVKCLRAYYYFNLAFYWGDVPMPLKTLTVKEANTILRTPQADVYEQIEEDLLDAIALLPEQRIAKEYGRYTKSAARVILSRLYLAQNRWTEAASTLKTIIDADLFQIDKRFGDESYEKLFQIGGETSPEIIFPIMYIKDLFTSALYQYYYPECIAGGWHQFAPYNELVKEYFCTDGKDIYTSPLYDDDDPYMNRDLRLYASFFLPPLGSYPGTKFNNITYNCYLGPNKNDSYNRYTRFNGYCPKKATDPSIINDINKTYVYTPLFRYAEVLLSYLEAVNESAPGSVNQSMLDLTINDIRDRVNLPPVQLADVGTQELLRTALRKERRVELAFEGQRYYDVLRWGTAMQELNHTFTGVKLSDDPSAPNFRGSGATASAVDENMYYAFEKRTWSAHNRYWPIPQAVLNINPALGQNQGYN